MKFIFTLDGYHGASGAWTILVPEASAGDLATRVYGLRLQAEGTAYPIGRVQARHLGSDACEYEVESLPVLAPRERKELARQAHHFLQKESDAFAAALASLAASAG